MGSSSSDGKIVCVHGQPAGPTCRGLVWGVYLDGGQAGITIHANIIGATLHGAVFDNAGGNNTQTVSAQAIRLLRRASDLQNHSDTDRV